MADIAVPIHEPSTDYARELDYLDDSTGVALTTTDTFQVPNDGRTTLVVKNGTGAVVITVVSHVTFDGLDVDDRDISIAADTDYLLGPFPPNVYNDNDGNISLEFDAVGDLEIAAVRG